MPRIRYFDAFLYPLRSPGRFLQIGWELLAANFKVFIPLVLLLACLLGIEYLTHSTRSQWVDVRHPWVVVALSASSLPLAFLAIYYSFRSAIDFGGYWLRAVQESAGGALCLPRPGPAPQGTWKLMPLCLLLLVPLLGVGGLGGWVVQRALGAAFQSTSDVTAPLMVWVGSGMGLLTLVLVFLVSILTGLVGNLALLRLAITGRLRSALNPVGVWRDLRQAWWDYLQLFLVMMVPGLVLQFCQLLAGSLNLLLVPLLGLLGLPALFYLVFLQANLLGQFHRAFLHQRGPRRSGPVLKKGCLAPLLILLGLGAGGLFLASLGLTYGLCKFHPHLVPSKRPPVPVRRKRVRPNSVPHPVAGATPTVSLETTVPVAGETPVTPERPVPSRTSDPVADKTPGPVAPLPSDVVASGSYDFTEVDRHALAAPPSAEANLDELAAYLKRGARNEREKARVIYRWITDRIDYDVKSLKTGNHPDPSPENALKSRLVVCDGYSRLFEALAQRMDLEAEFVVGHVKSGDRNPFEGLGHAWNAARVDGRWQLIDCTWGSRDVDVDAGTSVKAFTGYYFLTPPERLAYTHFPEDERWQCLDKPLTKEQFLANPVLREAFFESGLKLVKQADTANGTFQIVLEGPDDLMVLARLGEAEGDRSTMVSRQGARYIVDVSPTRPGKQSLWIFAGHDSDEGVPGAMIVAVDARTAGSPLPEVASLFVEQEAELVAPRSGLLSTSGSQHFDLRIPGAHQAYVKCGSSRIDLTRTDYDHFVGDGQLVSGEAVVYATMDPSLGYSEGLVKFEVR